MKSFNNSFSSKKKFNTTHHFHTILIAVFSISLIAPIFSQTKLNPNDNGNYALQFDGIDDEVLVGYNSILDITGDITICLWYKTESTSWGALVSNHDHIGPDHGYQVTSSSLYDEGGFIYFECAYNDDRDGQSTNASFNDGKWHFVSAVYTPDASSRGRIFVDGIEQTGYFWGGSVALPAIGATPEYALTIGSAKVQAWFEGVIDDVRIWNRALSQEEIQANMYRHLSGNEEGLIGYWPFNEGDGNLTNDLSGNNNNGTINGATWVGSAAPIGTVIIFSNPNYGYQNHNLFTTIQGANTHFSHGVKSIWLSNNESTIIADKYHVKSNTLTDAEFYIPRDAAVGQWDINVDTETDSIITMPVGIEILPPPSVISQESATSSWFKSVYAINNETCWSVGNDGSIQKTTDGGINWEIQNSSTSNVLYSVFFVNEMSGWAVGQNGTILHTVNGGVNWTTQNSGTSNNLQSIYFVDSNTGWTAGRSGTILKTTDNGINWESQNSETSSWLYSLYFTNTDNGWAVGSNGTILSTTNGGDTWNEQTSNTTNYLSSIHFYNSLSGWVVGSNGAILKTIDGGTNWLLKESNTSEWLKSVFFRDELTGWAVGTNGLLLMTTDGGDNWSTRRSFTSNTLNSIHFVDDTTGWVAGESGIILKLTMSEQDVTTIREKPALSSLPQTFQLYQNYPNPFNPITTIKYNLPKATKVSIKIYTILGELIKELVNEHQAAGIQYQEWDGTDQLGQNVSSGIYLHKLQAGNEVQVNKMIMIK